EGVIALAKAFVAVKVNTEESLAASELANKHGADTLPTIGFLSGGGRLYLRRVAYEDPATFRATLEEAKQLAQTVGELEARIARDPKDGAAQAGLGMLLFDRQLYAESLEPLRAAAKLDDARSAKE